MGDSEKNLHLTRRVAIASGIIGLAGIRAKPALSQEIALPDLEETLALLESDAGVRLIYSRFSLVFSLTFDLAVRLSGADSNNPEPAADLPVFPTERPASGEPFGLLTELSVDDQRSAVLAALTERDDPLGAPRGEALSVLINQIAESLAEFGYPVESEPISDALASCAHVERIAAVTRDTSEEASYLCRRFPFSWFCS